MEKLVYLVWKGHEDPGAFNQRLLGEVRRKLTTLGAERLQVNVPDDAVASGTGLRIVNLHPQPTALISFWLNSSHIRKPFEQVLEDAAPRIAGYAVTESTVLPITEPTPDGTRMHGFAQLALIQKPPRITREAYIDVWLSSHSKIACDTQSTFHYVQNIVNRVLTAGAPDLLSIVEEGFPLEALTDPHAFYAASSQSDYEDRLDQMMTSCGRFIDMDKIDVLVTSLFRFGGWADNKAQPKFQG
jgi:hypothetical protein